MNMTKKAAIASDCYGMEILDVVHGIEDAVIVRYGTQLEPQVVETPVHYGDEDEGMYFVVDTERYYLDDFIRTSIGGN